MSYSFTVRAATKAEAKEKIAAEFDKVVEGQPAHATDRAAAEAAAGAFVDLLGEPADGQVVQAVVHGSLGWRGEGDYTSANVGVQASIVLAGL